MSLGIYDSMSARARVLHSVLVHKYAAVAARGFWDKTINARGDIPQDPAKGMGMVVEKAQHMINDDTSKDAFYNYMKERSDQSYKKAMKMLVETIKADTRINTQSKDETANRDYWYDVYECLCNTAIMRPGVFFDVGARLDTMRAAILEGVFLSVYSCDAYDSSSASGGGASGGTGSVPAQQAARPPPPMSMYGPQSSAAPSSRGYGSYADVSTSGGPTSSAQSVHSYRQY